MPNMLLIACILAVKSFVFITDIHYPVNAGKPEEAVAAAMEGTDAHTVILGGDVYKSESSIDRAVKRLDFAFDSFHRAFGRNFLWVQGNHDSNSTAIKSRKMTEETALVPDTTVYNHTVGRMTAAITSDKKFQSQIRRMNLGGNDKEAALAWAGMHYSYDDKRSKIRFIVLETGDMGYAVRHIFPKTEIFAIQAQFLRERLKSTPKGYDVVITGHQIGDSYNGPSSQAYAAIFGPALEFRKEGRGKIIVISGDTHVDNSFSVGVENGKLVWDYCPSGSVIPQDRVLLVWTSCDALLSLQKLVDGPKVRISGSTAYEWRQKGGPGEHCFDIVSLTDDAIVCKREGAGKDRKFLYPKLK